MLEGACLLKASPCVARLLNLCQLQRWEMAFQCSLICIKTSHIYFPRTHGGSFPTTPIDWIRVHLSKWWLVFVFSIMPRGQWGLHMASQLPIAPPPRFLNATDPTLSPSLSSPAGEQLLPLHKEDSERRGWLGLWEMPKSWPPQLRGPVVAEEWRSQGYGVQRTGGRVLLLEEAGFGGTGHPVSQDDWSRLLLTSQP